LAAELCRLGHPLLAVAVLLGVDAYLRPKELLSIQAQDLLPPTVQALECWVLILFPAERGSTSKVGEQDDTIPLDLPRCPWLRHAIAALSQRPARQLLFDYTYPQFLSIFTEASAALGLKLVPYLMRHSGASIDRATDVRSQSEVGKRGRWASVRSIRRYEKRGRLNETWRTLSPRLQAHCVKCHASLESIVLHGEPPPLL